MSDKITATVTEIHKPKIWVERNIMGPLQIKMQYRDMEPFIFVDIHYDYLYTDNNHQHKLAKHILEFLGVKDDQS